MTSRRDFLLAIASAALLSGRTAAGSNIAESGEGNSLDWHEFYAKMSALAAAEAEGAVDQEAVVDLGMQYLRQLDIGHAGFRDAVADAYESGNRVWLWQRMIGQGNLNGGLLTIDRSELVPLHDHPGATGMIRIIRGETEVWQFDRLREATPAAANGTVELARTSRRVLRAGDMAVLTPDRGNIHALRSASSECAMLDFFIPPYDRRLRNWYEPVSTNWFDRETIACRMIPQSEYSMV